MKEISKKLSSNLHKHTTENTFLNKEINIIEKLSKQNKQTQNQTKTLHWSNNGNIQRLSMCDVLGGGCIHSHGSVYGDQPLKSG